ncbi:glycosyltransferase involved in cell wall biosynthesis [Hoeflea marina]|uniref:Glycosyltransferase involved in cell wall biosynthesis n=2 Tax=Hoeflea marina TaxID=274592 RepID=A0A317PPN6_9HYPH|nr:glycosyltransferase involved in cell wall biosynthesis [Hoeflea marina]
MAPASPRPLVSVALATFNGERHLAKQLDSLAAQTRLPDELVVGDDASSDSTLAVLHDFARRAPFPVEITSNPVTLGYSRNFIATAGRCRGELLFFCDQDDIWLPGKIARMAEIAAASPEGVITHDMSVFSSDESGPSFPSFFDHLRGTGFSRAVCLNGCAMAVKADFIRRWGWPEDDSGVSHDVWIALFASAFRQRRYCDEILLSHRLHGANASGWIPAESDRIGSRDWTPQRRALQSDTDLMIELLLKPWNLSWTDEILRAVEERRSGLDPTLLAALIGSLGANRRSHLRRRRWWRF